MPKKDNIFTIISNQPLSAKFNGCRFYNFPNFEGIKIPSLQKFCIVKRSVFQRGIRKRVKIEVPIKVVQVWLSLGEQHHTEH
jgi:hypothetical protein